MPLRCPLCDDTFAHHVTLRARASVHWRGKSFDAEKAVGEVGLAVMEAVGVPPGKLRAFLDEAVVEAFREDPTGEAPWRGEKAQEEGEDWELHVGLRREVSAGELESVAQAAVRALEGARNFGEAQVVREDPRVKDVGTAPGNEDDAPSGDATGEGESVDTWTNPALRDDTG